MPWSERNLCFFSWGYWNPRSCLLYNDFKQQNEMHVLTVPEIISCNSPARDPGHVHFPASLGLLVLENSKQSGLEAQI